MNNEFRIGNNNCILRVFFYWQPKLVRFLRAVPHFIPLLASQSRLNVLICILFYSETESILFLSPLGAGDNFFFTLPRIRTSCQAFWCQQLNIFDNLFSLFLCAVTSLLVNWGQSLKHRTFSCSESCLFIFLPLSIISHTELNMNANCVSNNLRKLLERLTYWTVRSSTVHAVFWSVSSFQEGN